jgi:PPIC-type PPIASE domain
MSCLWGLACWASLSALACSSGRDAAPASLRQTRLPASLSARVGSEDISIRTVSRITQAQGISARLARDRAVRDALFAQGARARFGAGSLVSVVERAAWARALLEGLKAEAMGHGPATDPEVAELSALRWQELDRPDSVRTTHAVVLVAKPESDALARAIAQRIWAAVRGVSEAKEFVRLAQTIPHDGVEVRVESLPAITSDGRSYYPENPRSDAASQHFDPDFARAAGLLAVGQTSEPVKSAFGYHVIFCEARLPGKHVPLEERRALLSDEVIKGRAERLKQELLARLSGAAPIQVARSVEDLTGRVSFAE